MPPRDQTATLTDCSSNSNPNQLGANVTVSETHLAVTNAITKQRKLHPIRIIRLANSNLNLVSIMKESEPEQKKPPSTQVVRANGPVLTSLSVLPNLPSVTIKPVSAGSRLPATKVLTVASSPAAQSGSPIQVQQTKPSGQALVTGQPSTTISTTTAKSSLNITRVRNVSAFEIKNKFIQLMVVCHFSCSKIQRIEHP